MRDRERDHGLYGLVIGTAVLLAAVILYFGARRLLSRPAPRPVPPVETPPEPQPEPAATRTETPATFLPPLQIIRKAGKPPQHKPPAIPMPPIKPDREGD